MRLCDHKIEKAAAKDKSRPVLTTVYLDTADAEAPVLVATDSYQLAVVPAGELEAEDTAGMIPAAAFATARKVKVGSRVTASGDVKASSPEGVVTMMRPEGQFPSWRQLIPTDEPVIEFGLSAEVLLKLAQAVTTGKGAGVKLSVISPLKPIRVTALDSDGGYGIVMPIRLK